MRMQLCIVRSGQCIQSLCISHMTRWLLCISYFTLFIITTVCSYRVILVCRQIKYLIINGCMYSATCIAFLDGVYTYNLRKSCFKLHVIYVGKGSQATPTPFVFKFYIHKLFRLALILMSILIYSTRLHIQRVRFSRSTVFSNRSCGWLLLITFVSN